MSISVLAAVLCGLFAGCNQPKDIQEDVLGIPAAVEMTEATETSLKFNWEAVDGADFYGYRLTDSKGEVKAESATKATSKTFSGLLPNSRYSFAVRSQKGSSYSEYSKAVEASTLERGSGSTGGNDNPGSGDNPGGNDNLGGEQTSYYAQFQIPSAEEDGTARAFPGAQGGGMNVTGGRGGVVYHVTSLDDTETPGTLRYGIRKVSGPRTIVFDVAGVIKLTKALKIESGDITIAGQTAPGDGICLRNYTFGINANNVIIRYLRFRMGDTEKTEDDALNSYHKSGSECTGIIIDHCTMSWCTDECGSFYGNKNFTLQYCILSESLRNSVHDKGAHGYGGIWGGENASFHHNLLAHHDSRNPRFDHDYVSNLKGPVHYYNNVVYNWGGNSSYGGEGAPGTAPKQINMVNNYYKPGPATASSKQRFVNPTTKCSNCCSTDQYSVVPGTFYLSGNVMAGNASLTSDNWAGVVPDESAKKDKTKANSYQGTQPSNMQTAEKAYETVLATAGASLRRDSIDERIVKETREGKFTYTGSNGSNNGFIDTQGDVGGWPEYSANTDELAKVKDSDGDGMPDWFEKQFGLDSASKADGNTKTLDKSGRYTNFEMYLHYLVKDIVAQQYK